MISTFIGKDTKVYTDDDFRREYIGATLQTYEHNGYDDSDFMAIVWDEAKQTIKTVCYATTRGWTYLNGATVDATPEVLAKAQKHRYEMLVGLNVDASERDSKVPKTDRRCRVTRGRKVPQGTEGIVFWIGPDRYASSRWATVYRAGIKLDDGRKMFVPLDYLQVCFPHLYRLTEAEVRERMGTPKQITNFYLSVHGVVNMVA